MRLCHRSVSAIENIGNELFSVRQLNVLTIDVLRTMTIDEKQMVFSFTPGNIAIFAEFDVAFSAENR